MEELLVPIICDINLYLKLSAYAALSLSLIYVGKCEENVANSLITTLHERFE